MPARTNGTCEHQHTCDWDARRIRAGTASMAAGGGKMIAGAGTGTARPARGCAGQVGTATARCGIRAEGTRRACVRVGSATPAADLLRRCCSHGGLERLRTHARRGGRRSRGRPHFWMVCGARALPKLRRRAPNWPLESSRPSVCARRRRPAHARRGARVSHGSVHMLVPGSVCWRANYGVPGRGTSYRALRASWRVREVF